MKKSKRARKRLIVRTSTASSFGPFIPLPLDIKEVSLVDLTPHPAQPPRHSEEQCQDLFKIIFETRIIDPVIIVPVGNLAAKPEDKGKYYIVNGNRRFTVAKMLGLKTINATVLSEVYTESDMMRLWSLFNGGSRRISGKEIFWSWASIKNQLDRMKYLSHIASWNPQCANQITALVAYIGEEKAIRYAKSGSGREAKFSPNIVTRVKDLLKEAESQGYTEFQTPAFIQKMVAWFYQQNMYREVGDAKKMMPSWGGTHPQLFIKIMEAIIANRPFSINMNVTVGTALPVGQTRAAQVFNDGTVVTVPNMRRYP